MASEIPGRVGVRHGSTVMTMYISFVGPLPPHPGGIAQHGARLVAALRHGHRVDVVTWSSMYPRFRYHGRPPIVTSAKRSEAVLRWWDPTSWYRAGRRVRGSDLVVVQWVHPFHALAIGTVIRVAAPSPTVLMVHNIMPHERFPLQQALTTWALRTAGHAVVHSNQVASELTGWVKDIRVRVVQHPPNLDLSPEPPPDRPPLRLLFLGYVRPYKGLSICIEAVRETLLKGLDVELTVAGEFWESLDKYHEMLRNHDLESRVRLEPGYVSDSDIARYLSSHHALVAPYQSATQSGLVPLAFAAGRPAVVANVGGLVEQVEDGLNGTVAIANDPRAFADAIVRLEKSYARLQVAASESVATWKDVARAVTDVSEGSSSRQ